MKKHLKGIVDGEAGQQVNLVLDKKLEKLSRFSRALEETSFIKDITYKLQIAGYKILGHQYLLYALLAASALASVVAYFTLDLCAGDIFRVTGFLSFLYQIKKRY